MAGLWSAIPVGSARVVVTIDGKPYAGFINRACAEEAVRMWTGEINGAGLPVPDQQRAGAGWLAVRGHAFSIVER
jgi:hypothetical protein